MADRDKGIEAPSLGLLALEGRGLFAIPALIAATPYLATAPRGPRHTVMVLPGLGADDRSTFALRQFLTRLGYDVQGWGRGRNIRPADADLSALVDQVHELRARSGTPVSLVGWSRGGILAREVARRLPEDVRLVVTLGSPFAAPDASNVRAVWSLLTGQAYTPPTAERVAQLAAPLPVPSTSIFTRQDGVVAWRACLEQEGGQRENVEVRTTHLGLGFHPPALWVVADRLAQPLGSWAPFKPAPHVAPFFPKTSI
jgi:pimeloyl-ACP methyl ester carboxylesterase